MAMLTIRDPRAAARQSSASQAAADTLEPERLRGREAPLATRIGALAARATAIAGPRAHAMTKAEIDALSEP